jgi:EmrB/QacA subfamily drug resistance transporter
MNDLPPRPDPSAGLTDEPRPDATAPEPAGAPGAPGAASPPARPPLAHKDIIRLLWGVFLSIFLAAINQTIVAAALPTIGRDLADFENLSWVITAYLLTSTMVAPLYGKLADIHGRRAMIMIGVGLFLFGTVLCALSTNMLALIAGRAIQGLGGGGILPLTQTIVADVVAPRQRGRYQAYIGAVWGTAGIIAPLIGGTVTEHLHWSLIFWINVPVGIAAMVLSATTLKRLPRFERRHKLDVVGAVLMTAAAATLFLALTWGGVRYAWTSLPVMALIAASAALWVGFGLRLVRAPEPFVSLKILADPVVRMGSVASACALSITIGLTVYLPLYYETVHGLSASASGLALIPIAVLSVPGTIVASRGMMYLTHYKRLPMVMASVSLLAQIVLVIRPDLPLWLSHPLQAPADGDGERVAAGADRAGDPPGSAAVARPDAARHRHVRHRRGVSDHGGVCPERRAGAPGRHHHRCVQFPACARRGVDRRRDGRCRPGRLRRHPGPWPRCRAPDAGRRRHRSRRRVPLGLPGLRHHHRDLPRRLRPHGGTAPAPDAAEGLGRFPAKWPPVRRRNENASAREAGARPESFQSGCAPGPRRTSIPAAQRAPGMFPPHL